MTARSAYIVIALVVCALSARSPAVAGQLPPKSNEDCITYDPNTARFQEGVAGTYVLMSGKTRLAVFDDRQDATNAVALARQHTALCFIGRKHSILPGEVDHRFNDAVHYWKGFFGTAPTINPESCIVYDPSTLTLVAYGGGWLVVKGTPAPKDASLVVAGVLTREDADAALAVARQYRAYCTIGHDPGVGIGDPIPYYLLRDTRLHYFGK